MIDLRYHIYSLVAVFLALAVGMFIGQAFVPTSPVERQQSKIAQLNRMLNSMETDFAALRSEVVDQQGQIKELEGSLKRSDEYCRAFVPDIVKDRLLWKSVAIIQTGDYGEDTAAIKNVLEEAGARVNSITQIKNRREFSDPAKAAAITANCAMSGGQEPCRALLRVVAGGAIAGAYYDKLLRLRDMGLVTLSGDYSRHNESVVILGGARGTGTSTALDAVLIEEIRAASSTVVGCEPVDAAISYIPTYKKAGIASVDNIDKPFGQIGLVCALAGENGSFGIKSTADRLMPQTLRRKTAEQ